MTTMTPLAARSRPMHGLAGLGQFLRAAKVHRTRLRLSIGPITHTPINLDSTHREAVFVHTRGHQADDPRYVVDLGGRSQRCSTPQIGESCSPNISQYDSESVV